LKRSSSVIERAACYRNSNRLWGRWRGLGIKWGRIADAPKRRSGPEAATVFDDGAMRTSRKTTAHSEA
jgi:hypothetical protein